MDGGNRVSPDFMELRIRAEFLELCGDSETAEKLRVRSLEIAREVDFTCYSYQLLWRNLVDPAIDLLERAAARFPDSWNVWDTLGEAYAQRGDVRRAIDSYSHAVQLVDDEAHRPRIEQLHRDLISLGVEAVAGS